MLLEESVALSTTLAYKQGIARALHNLGRVAHVQGDQERATARFEKSLAAQ